MKLSSEKQPTAYPELYYQTKSLYDFFFVHQFFYRNQLVAEITTSYAHPKTKEEKICTIESIEGKMNKRFTKQTGKTPMDRAIEILLYEIFPEKKIIYTPRGYTLQGKRFISRKIQEGLFVPLNEDLSYLSIKRNYAFQQ